MSPLWAAAYGLFGVGWVCQFQAWRKRMEEFWATGLWAVANTVIAIADMLSHAATWALWSTGCALVCAWLCRWNWRRRKRRRAPRALGAKARARIAAMVTRMRERPARPVLRPVHGGAR